MTVQLGSLLEGYLDLRWRIDPVEGTLVGRHDVDDRYADVGVEAVREYTAALRSYAASLEEWDVDTLDDEIDRTAALHAVRHDLLVLERERPFARNAAWHVRHALTGIYMLLARNAQDPPRRAASLLARLKELPDFLRRAVEVLEEPRPDFLEAARAMLPGGVALFRHGLDDAGANLSALDPAELAEARHAAYRALTEFGDAVALMAERARGGVGIGRDLFDRKLHTAHMIQENADELARYVERLRGEALRELEGAAAAIEPGARWRDVADRLRADAPPARSVLDEYRNALNAAHAFVAERDLLPIPNVPLDVVATPSYLRTVIPVAAYQPAGAFDAEQRGTFFVTPPSGDGPSAQHPRGLLPLVAAHEGIPGHHLHVSSSNHLQRPLRRALRAPAALEGWALYCETLMAEEGFLDAPAERFWRAYGQLLRAHRGALDVALHTRAATTADAVRVLRSELGLDEQAAAAEVRRVAIQPTQAAYAVAQRDVFRLRDDARRARGADFSLTAFHTELLQYGALPVALARWGMGLVG